MAWVEALSHNRVWDETLDRERFPVAFRSIAATETQWPSPTRFVEHLPPRPVQQALPAKVYDRDKATENMLRLRKLLYGQEE